MSKIWHVVAVISVVVLLATSLLPSVGFIHSAHASSPSDGFSDNFTQDSSLNTNLWAINGPVGTIVGQELSSPPNTIATPTVQFSSTNGMGISGVSGLYEAAMIQSFQSFTPPFTLQALAMATVCDGRTFVLAISSVDGGQGIAICGDPNPGEGNYYGVWDQISQGAGASWTGLADNIVASPGMNVWYQLTISVDSSGNAKLVVSSQGQTLGSVSRSVGIGPFYILIGQAEGWPYIAGPNQAWWQSVSLVSGTPGTTVPTTTIVTSSANSSNYGQSINFTATINPTPDGGTVLFQDNGTNFANLVIINGSGQASYVASNLSVGSHNITANYSGDANFTGSMGSLAQMVSQGITFTESGLPNNTPWALYLSGPNSGASNFYLQNTNVNGGSSYIPPLSNGNYNYYIFCPHGWQASPNAGEITLNGAGSKQAITFTPYPNNAVLTSFSIPQDQWGQQNPQGGVCYAIASIELDWFYFHELDPSLPRLQTICNNISDPASISSTFFNMTYLPNMLDKLALLLSHNESAVYQDMENEINAGDPVMVLMTGKAQGDWLSTEGHAVVAYGYSETGDHVEFYVADSNYPDNISPYFFPDYTVSLTYDKSSQSFTYYWNWSNFLVGDISLDNVVSELGTLVSLALGPETGILISAIIQSGAANVVLNNGVTVDITGSTAYDGTSVSVTGTDFGSISPSGIGAINLNGVQYYDVKVSPSSNLGANAMAQVSITSSAVTAHTIMQYWYDGVWNNASNLSVLGSTISGYIPVSALEGTSIAIGTALNLTVSKASTDWGLIGGIIAAVVVVGVVTWLVVRRRRRKTTGET